MSKYSIDTPCSEDVSNMKRCGNQLHCEVCYKSVTDLSSATTKEVDKHYEKNGPSCVILHERHLATSEGKYKWINQIEGKVSFLGLKRSAVIVTALLLILSACSLRRKKPTRTMGTVRFLKQNEKPKEVDQQ